jgi:hypothetical protein
VAHSPADYLALARDPDIDVTTQLMLLDQHLPFVTEALAANPASSPYLLLRILGALPSAGWSANHVVELVVRHPSATRVVLLAARDRVLAQLATGGRPFAAGIALAGRDELAPEDVASLLEAPGSSRRFRSGLRRELAARPSAAGAPRMVGRVADDEIDADFSVAGLSAFVDWLEASRPGDSIDLTVGAGAGVYDAVAARVLRAPVAGDDQKVRLTVDRTGPVIEIGGSTASIGYLTEALRDLECGNHLHVEHFDGHLWLEPDSMPAVFSVTRR